jgi:isopentenyl phosphate kinase
MSERILLKLGGSIITDKSGPGMIKHEEIARISEIIATRDGISMVIVHGAGSCGHPEAERFRIAGGVSRVNREGIYYTHRAVRNLNDCVVGALRKAGAEAVGIHPFSACIADKGRLLSREFPQVERLLGLGIIPVLHGDVVMDMTQGACIISGDQLVRVLSTVLKMDRIGLATDVPGVFGDGSLIPEITPEGVKKLKIGDSRHTDVTGGMKGKVDELLALAGMGIPSDIFHVSRIGDFLDGKPDVGTRVRRDEIG